MELGVAVAVLCVAVLGVAAQWVAWRFRLPAIVLLFAAGLAVGPGLQILRPEAMGPALQPLVGLAVAVVVFEGGLALDLRELRAAGGGVLRLCAVALPVTLVLALLAAHWVGGLGWGPALLYGTITVVTGPTVVLPMLRHTRLERRARAFLKWEAILNDPIGAILSALALQVLLSQGAAGGGTGGVALHALLVVAGVLVALALGVGGALLVRWAFLRDQVPEVLKTPMLLALALGVFVLSNLVLAESGLMAATILGIAVANLRIPGLPEQRRAKESLVLLIVSALFVTLTAELQRATLAQLSWPLLGLTLAMLVAVRPAAILLATLGSDLTWPERLLPAWIAPRGIVAAAVAGVAGLRLQSAGYQGAEEVMPAVFALIAATMVLHGFSLAPLARRLRLTLSHAPGVMIVGASAFTTAMAEALQHAGVPVLLTDTFPGALNDARDRGLSVLQAEILSRHGEEELAGRAVDYVIAATPDEIYNGLACTRLAPELGRQRVFQLAPPGRAVDLWRGLSRESRGRVFGRGELSFETFEARCVKGWRFLVVDALPEAAPEDGTGAPAAAGRAALPLLLLRAGGALAVFSSEEAAPPTPAEGDRMLVFAPASALPDARQEGERTEDHGFGSTAGGRLPEGAGGRM